MISRANSGRDPLTLVVGATVVAVLVTSTRLWPRLRSWQLAQADSAAAMANDLAAAASAARALPALRDSLRVRRELRTSLDSSLIHAPSAAIAAAEAASIVEGLAVDAGVSLGSQQVMADSAAVAGLRHVTVRLVGTAGIRELAAFLRAVTTGSPLLSVRDISVAQADPTAASAHAQVLRLDLIVEALCIIDAPSATTK